MLYNSGVVNIASDFRVGPYGGKCTQIGTGCMCNQGMRSIFLTELQQDGSILFREDMTYSFSSCGFQPEEFGDIIFGQTAALSGPSGSLGRDMKLGILAAFHQANEIGRVQGRKLKLISLDDQYEPDPALNNTINLIFNYRVIALLGTVGTPTAQVAVPISLQNQVPFIGAFTGARFLRRPFEPLIVNMRASYIDETAAMVNYLVGIKGFFKISIFYQSDSFGEAGLEGLQMALSARGLPIYSNGTYVRNTVDVEKGLDHLATSMTANLGDPEAIVIIGTYEPLAKFVKLAKQRWPNVFFCTVSFVGATSFSEKLGDAESRRNVFVTQVVPLPTDTSRPLIRQYVRALQSVDPTAQPGFVTLEGYMVARLVISTLERVTHRYTRENLINAIYSTGVFPLDDFTRLGPYGPNCTGPGCRCNQGMHEVFLTNMDDAGLFHLVPGAEFSFETCGFQEQFRPPLCTEEHWSYHVTNCQPSTQTRDVLYSWKNPFHWNPNLSLECRGGRDLPGNFQLGCERVLAESSTGLLIIVLNGLGLFASLMLAVGVLWKRNTKLMINSQYRFLLLMIVGCSAAMLSKILGVGEASNRTCIVSPVFFSIGIAVMLVSIFVRINRIKRIFDNPAMKKVKITEKVWNFYVLLFIYNS